MGSNQTNPIYNANTNCNTMFGEKIDFNKRPFCYTTHNMILFNFPSHKPKCSKVDKHLFTSNNHKFVKMHELFRRFPLLLRSFTITRRLPLVCFFLLFLLSFSIQLHHILFEFVWLGRKCP